MKILTLLIVLYSMHLAFGHTVKYTTACESLSPSEKCHIGITFKYQPDSDFKFYIHSTRSKNIAMQFELSSKLFTYNSYYNEKWGEGEKTLSPFEEQSGEEVKISILIGTEGFEIIFNNQYRKFYQHRLEIRKFDSVTVESTDNMKLKITTPEIVGSDGQWNFFDIQQNHPIRSIPFFALLKNVSLLDFSKFFPNISTTVLEKVVFH